MLLMKETSKIEIKDIKIFKPHAHVHTHIIKMLPKRVKCSLIEENMNCMEMKKNIS